MINTYRKHAKRITIGDQNTFYVIVLFEDTPLRDVQMLRITDLEQIVKHSESPMDERPPLFYWKSRNDKRLFKPIQVHQFIKVRDLIDLCEGVKLWFGEYHPEYII